MNVAKSALSKTQIDRLGDRLRSGNFDEVDLRLLDAYRRSFGEAYERVVGEIRETLGLEPTGRQPKSKTSIVEKLRRESIRLSQMQDIAGCRVIVNDISEQEAKLRLLKNTFDDFTVVDRRNNSSHGYRAIHVIVKSSDRMVEIQLRTAAQHLWAELSERISDEDPAIKYGGGEEADRWILDATSEAVTAMEAREQELLELELRALGLPDLASELRDEIDAARASLEAERRLLIEIITDNIRSYERGNHALPN